MVRLPSIATRTDTLFPDTPRFLSLQPMSFRNISAWSIRNPVPSIVLFVALTLAGVVSFMRMDVNNQPDIDFPIVWVAISQPGAAPSEMERSEEHTSELQSLMRISYAVFCLKKKKYNYTISRK